MDDKSVKGKGHKTNLSWFYTGACAQETRSIDADTTPCRRSAQKSQRWLNQSACKESDEGSTAEEQKIFKGGKESGRQS